MKVKFSWVAILVMLPVTGMWSQKVESQYDHSNDFRRYKTYAWRERKLLTQQSKQNQQLIDEALVKAVNTQLQAKGLREDNNAPDFYVTFSGGSAIADAQSGHAYLPRDLALGVAPVWTSNTIPGSVPNVWVSMEGMLLFEVTDAKTGSVTWSTFLKKKIKKPGKMPTDLDRVAAELAQKAFKNFPPRTAGK
jgi:Domain of unknown function (DUF4136)